MKKNNRQHRIIKENNHRYRPLKYLKSLHPHLCQTVLLSTCFEYVLRPGLVALTIDHTTLKKRKRTLIADVPRVKLSELVGRFGIGLSGDARRSKALLA